MMRAHWLSFLILVPLSGCNLLLTQYAKSQAPDEDCKPIGEIQIESRSFRSYSATVYRFPVPDGISSSAIRLTAFNNQGHFAGSARLGLPFTADLYATQPCQYDFLFDGTTVVFPPYSNTIYPYTAGGMNNYNELLLSGSFNGPLGIPYPRVLVWQDGLERDLPLPTVDAIYSAVAINDSATIAGVISYLSTSQIHYQFSGLLSKPPSYTDHLARWNPTDSGWEFEDLGVPPLNSDDSVTAIEVHGINSVGHIVGTVWTTASGPRPFVWSSGEWNLLPLGSTTGGFATAINDADEVVGIIGVNHDAAVWINGQLNTLQESSANEAYSINNQGDVVGGPEVAGGAVLWHNGVATELNSFLPSDVDFVLTRAMFINDEGQILVLGRPITSSVGDANTILIVLTPQPSGN